MTRIYCGIASEVPKGMERGDMKQCLEKNQVKYFGVKKIDSRLLESTKKDKKDTKSRTKVIVEVSKYRGRVKKWENMLEDAKSKKDKDNAKKEIDMAKKELKKNLDLLKAIEKERESKKSSKKMSRVSSNKSSNKSSKKSSKKMSHKGSKKW